MIPTAKRLAGAAVLAALALAASPGAAPARASAIVYSCAPNLCAVDPDSAVTATITDDGASSPYRLPSVSRDGGVLAAARGDDVVVGPYGSNLTARWTGSRDINDVAISPDGSAVGESHSYVENRFGCPFSGGCLELVDMSESSYVPGAGAGASSFVGGGGVGFLGGALLSSYYTLKDDQHHICVAPTPGTPGSSCEQRVNSPRTLSQPDGSPDGKLIAAGVIDAAPAKSSAVYLFDAATGAELRRLADNAGSPAFSPDGKEIAYAGADGWIYLVATQGGEPRRLAQGASPSWGGGDGPGPQLASRSLRLRQGRVPVKLRCGEGVSCRGTLRLRKGKVALGGRAFKLNADRSATVRVKLGAKGARVLAAKARHRVTVEVKPRRGERVTTRLTLRR